jgi:hypothetical protein
MRIVFLPNIPYRSIAHNFLISDEISGLFKIRNIEREKNEKNSNKQILLSQLPDVFLIIMRQKIIINTG